MVKVLLLKSLALQDLPFKLNGSPFSPGGGHRPYMALIQEIIMECREVN